MWGGGLGRRGCEGGGDWGCLRIAILLVACLHRGLPSCMVYLTRF